MTDVPIPHEAAEVQQPSPGQSRGKRGLFALAGLALVLLGFGGYAFWRQAAAPKPPLVALQGVDPAIVKLIGDEQGMVRRSPYSGPVWGSLGMVLYAHAFAPQANVCFREAERLDSQEPRWPYLRAVCILQEDPDHSDALPDLRQAARLAGDTPDAPRLLLAETLLEVGRPGDAEPLLRQTVQQDPGNARALLGLGRIELGRGHLAAARGDLLKSFQGAPAIKATQILLAQTFSKMGNAAASAAFARQAAKVPDTNDWPDAYKAEALQLQVGKVADIQRAESLILGGQFAPAAALMQQTVQDYPDAARPWMLLGAADTGSGDPVAGEAALRKALALDPASAECLNHLGDAIARQGRSAEAAIYFTKALAINPRSAEYHFNLGVCLFREHQTAGAVKEFETAVQIDPDAVKNHAGLADALTQAHQTGAAIQQLQIGLRLNPHDPILEKSLAKLQGASGH